MSALSTEVFVEPLDDGFLVYAPLRHVAFIANAAAAIQLKCLEGSQPKLGEVDPEYLGFLASLGLMQEGAAVPEPMAKGDFGPTHAVLMPTSACTLNCIYCYSHGGVSRTQMRWGTAKAAIDLVVAHAIRTGKNPRVTFHGGGEPTLNWKLLVRATDHVRKAAARGGVTARIGLVTNGVFSSRKCEWIAKNCDTLTISLDGPDEIQLRQRPMKGGGSSFPHVYSTCLRLSRDRVRYMIRATVTAFNVDQLPALVEFFARLQPHAIQLEPLTTCGRCAESDCPPPAADTFVTMFKKAWATARRCGITLSCSGTRTSRLVTQFCGAAGSNFIVTPTGQVVSCHRAYDGHDSCRSEFVYGVYDDRVGAFVFDAERLRLLRNVSVFDSSVCLDCFAKWHCAGGCYHQNMVSGADFRKNEADGRCMITRDLMKHNLAEHVRTGIADFTPREGDKP
jgi:uncharacterized protein